MTDRFAPISMAQLTDWIFDEIGEHDSIFGIPRSLFFTPSAADLFKVDVYGKTLDTPFGVAAGPHSQMAQNIVVAWLTGARFIELKTVQTLDELDVSKPCIDMEDEGYNVEWSQELKVEASFEEYVRAWVLIHALHRYLGFPGDAPGVIFNISVGYNLEGIKKPNVQWFLGKMRKAEAEVAAYVKLVGERMPDHTIEAPASLSDNVTLSTMHGCPPEEIELIAAYLLKEQGFHTSVKLNPTLLGPTVARRILNDDLGYTDVTIPDVAFAHDLKWADAEPMLHRLTAVAAEEGLTFGVKLTNTLEVENHRTAFSADEKMMYLSGRPLHGLSTALAAKIADTFDGELLMSFAGGADAFNVAHLLGAGMRTVTVCSDLLKSGGYTRMLQYLKNASAAIGDAGCIPGFVTHSARTRAGFVDAFTARCSFRGANKLATALQDTDPKTAAEGWATEHGVEHEALWAEIERVSRILNAAAYATEVLTAPLHHKDRFDTSRSKSARKLRTFDCVMAPCTDNCAVDQDVPAYMRAVREGRYADAIEIVREENPIGATLGNICDRKCQDTCVRTHFDDPLAIREIKRFIMSQERQGIGESTPEIAPKGKAQAGKKQPKIAVIGAGPLGLAAARTFVKLGYPCTVFEQNDGPGGIAGATIPVYRLPQEIIDQDTAYLTSVGVVFQFGQKAGRDFTLKQLRKKGFKYVVLGVGAQVSKRLGVPGEDAEGVIYAIDFLRAVRDGDAPTLGHNVAIIGAGDVSMDSARTAFRLAEGQVSVIYRRTIGQMPADPEEIAGLLEEGVKVAELRQPKEVIKDEAGKLKAIRCDIMALGPRGDDGRRRPISTGETEDIEVDTLIVAISQDGVLDFFGRSSPTLTRKGYYAINPETGETSVPRVFSGGDAALNGPNSAVQAAGDGKRIAEWIYRIEEDLIFGQESVPAPDMPARLAERTHRQFRAPLPHRPADDRKHFEPVMFTLSEEAAKAEAERCLSCDEVCSLCVSVCPNLAFLTYSTEHVETVLHKVVVTDEQLMAAPDVHFVVQQTPQVAVFNGFCNECGNCATFCPTADAPYRTKPRIYMDRGEFEGQDDNAYMMDAHAGIIEGRFLGDTHRVERRPSLDGQVWRYTAPGLIAELSDELFPNDLKVPDETPEGTEHSLKPAAKMITLVKAFNTSVGYLPRANMKR